MASGWESEVQYSIPRTGGFDAQHLQATFDLKLPKNISNFPATGVH